MKPKYLYTYTYCFVYLSLIVYVLKFICIKHFLLKKKKPKCSPCIHGNNMILSRSCGIKIYIYVYLTDTYAHSSRLGRDCMIVGFTTTFAISTYNH